MVHSILGGEYISVVDIESRGQVEDQEVAQRHGRMLELAVSLAFLIGFLLLLHLDQQLRYLCRTSKVRMRVSNMKYPTSMLKVREK